MSFIRFCPHLLLKSEDPEVTADEIVEAVLRGFKDGEEQYGVTARAILCCIRGSDDQDINLPRMKLDSSAKMTDFVFFQP